MSNKNIKSVDSNIKRTSYLNIEVGHKGEDLACQYLQNSGFEIFGRNYRDNLGEIDIIAYKNYVIHFVEVKSVSRETHFEVIRETFSSPNEFYNQAEKVDKAKLRKIQKVAERFLFENSLEQEAYQFDLILVDIYDGGFKYKFEFIENINNN